MKYRTVLRSGEKVSVLGYGGMRFPVKAGIIDEEKAKAQLRSAIDRGVNYIDTAYFYHGGQSESFIGRALKDGYRERVNLATKMPPWSVHKESDLELIFEDQRRKLMVDDIDFYLLHAVNRESWEKFQAVNALDFLTGLKASGKIRHVGFSFHGDRALFKEVIDAYPWDFCQIQYNILDDMNQAGTEGLKYAASKEIAVFVMEPLRGGNLVRKIPQEVLKIYDDMMPHRKPVEWALQWIWNQPEVTMILSGMTEDEHLDENILYADRSGVDSLSEMHLEALHRVKETYQSLLKVPCTGCQYCMPCPFGVDIPRCFDLYNSIFLLNQKNMKGFYWLQLGGANGAPSYASLCKECGKCVKLCPQGIAIPEELRIVRDYMETPLMKPAIAGSKLILGIQKKFARRK